MVTNGTKRSGSLWWAEAERHGALPLDDRLRQLFRRRPDDHSPHRPDRRYRYRPPMSPIPTAASPLPGGSAWDLRARITRDGGDEGTLFAVRNANAGISVFIQADRLVLDYNAVGDHSAVESTAPVPAGDALVSVHLRRTPGSRAAARRARHTGHALAGAGCRLFDALAVEYAQGRHGDFGRGDAGEPARAHSCHSGRRDDHRRLRRRRR